MRQFRHIFMMLFLLIIFGSVSAQEKEETSNEEISKVEVFGGYSLLRSESENFHGWKTAVGFNVNRWLAITVDADGHYFSESTSAGKLKKSEYSLTVGPHFTLRNKSRIVPFAYATTGAVWEKESISGIGETKTGFAFETGGGFDWELSKKVSIRVIDISASITRIDGRTTTKPKFSTGLVFQIGRR